MHWDDTKPLLFHIVKKSTGELIPINYEADPMGFIHIINAYEENDHIFVDAPFKSTAIDYRY